MRDGYLAILLALVLTGLGSLALLIQVLDIDWEAVDDEQVQVLGLGSKVPLGWFVDRSVACRAPRLSGRVDREPGAQARRVRNCGRHGPWSPWCWSSLRGSPSSATGGSPQWAWCCSGLAEVLLLAGAHYLVPLLQSFPRVRRSLALKVLVLAVVVPILLSNESSAFGLLAAGAVIVVGGFAVRGLFRQFRHRASRSLNPRSLWVLGVIPFAAVVVASTLLTVVFPAQVLGAAYGLDDQSADQHAGPAVRMNALATLVLVCLGVLVAGFVMR